MQKELQNLSMILGLTFRDVKIITDIVEHFSNEGIGSLKHHLITIFRHEIKPEHFIVLGVLIGLCLATDQEHDTFLKHNSYQSCLRQN